MTDSDLDISLSFVKILFCSHRNIFVITDFKQISTKTDNIKFTI